VNRSGVSTPFVFPEPAGPVVSCALHAGHEIRDSLRPFLATSDDDRRREEDPCTELIADVDVGLIQVLRSRFEVDLNRQRSRAVYSGPEDTWGLDPYRVELPAHERDASLHLYDEFYTRLERMLGAVVASHGCAIVLDVHSYNHRRAGPEARHDDPAANPEVNLGTGTMDASRWSAVASGVVSDLSGAGLDVRENVRFTGGHMAAWAHKRFGGDVCVLALEFKKTYIDEWTGEVDGAHVERLRTALAACVPGITAAACGLR
jgi:N-formylglutamate amidohydrolase